MPHDPLLDVLSDVQAGRPPRTPRMQTTPPEPDANGVPQFWRGTYTRAQVEDFARRNDTPYDDVREWVTAHGGTVLDGQRAAGPPRGATATEPDSILSALDTVQGSRPTPVADDRSAFARAYDAAFTAPG